MRINSITPQYQNKNYANKNAMNKNHQATSFKGGAPKPVESALSKFYEKVANSNGFQKFIKGFSKSNNTFTHVLIAESVLLSGFYMINTLRNEKIKKEQKPQMLINDTLTLGVSAAGAYLAEDKITNLVQKGSEKYFEKHSDFFTKLGKETEAKLAKTPIKELLNKVADVVNPENTGNFKEGLDDITALVGHHLKNITADGKTTKAFQLSAEKVDAIKTSVKEAVNANTGNVAKAQEKVKEIVNDSYIKSAARAEADKSFIGLNKLKVLVIFGIIYRYLGPVVITPIANKLSSKLFENKNNQNKAEQLDANPYKTLSNNVLETPNNKQLFGSFSGIAKPNVNK